MRVAVGEAVHVAALAFDAGLLGAGRAAHTVAPAANTNVGVFSLSQEALIFVECSRVNCSTDVFTREIAVARRAQTVQVCISDFRNNIRTYALLTHICGLAARQLRPQRRRVVVAAYHAAETRMFVQSETDTHRLNDGAHAALLLGVGCAASGGSRGVRSAAHSAYFVGTASVREKGFGKRIEGGAGGAGWSVGY